MQISYKNKGLEKALISFNAAASVAVVATFIALFGFTKPLLAAIFLYYVQIGLLFVFVAEKTIRRFNAVSKYDFWRINWLEVPLLAALAIVVSGAGTWSGETEPAAVRHFAVGVYLVVQVVSKLCRTSVSLAASGRNPTRTLIISFVVLILSGSAALCLPTAQSSKQISFVDALFTATSATCVTGLVVKDIGRDFSLTGQVVILSLIQLGGLGIVLFGAVFGLLLGQALSVRESAAMQDLLSENTLGRIGKMIFFIFIATILIEAAGAAGLVQMWDDVPGRAFNLHQRWYYSIFHSISSFCNAGFTLFPDNLISYNRCWGLYLVICPLIILGGLGFGVLYDLGSIALDKIARPCKKFFNKRCSAKGKPQAPKRLWLQSKIVLCVTACLIIIGMLALFVFEKLTGQGEAAKNFGILDGLFQSVTARTAGFNTMNIGTLSDAGKFVLILLMFIGGSPGGTAGGIKTVTLAVVIMAVVATFRRRDDIEVFRRSIRMTIVRRAIVVTVLFVVVLFLAVLGLSITETSNRFTMMTIFFETASALGTVGLSTGITPALTAAGKMIIIIVMLIGRLGPLTLLAALTFNLKRTRYNYPDETVIVG